MIFDVNLKKKVLYLKGSNSSKDSKAAYTHEHRYIDAFTLPNNHLINMC